MRGQVQTMKASFNGLLIGLIGAIVLVYMLIVVNFQSLLDPFIIITALPAALAGIVWMLFLTHTTVSVPALTGAIMCMGVATANSVLVVSFARERMNAGDDAFEAALQAGFTRLRPVLMTALAMIIGMIPMALGLGDGGEQNAPLGRAVIGGLIFATVATLFFVPTVFSIIHGRTVAAPAFTLRRFPCLSTHLPTRQELARKIRRYALILLVVALILGVWGEVSRVTARAMPSARKRLGRRSAHRRHRRAEPHRARRRTGAAGHGAGFHRGADLRAHQRLSEGSGTPTSAPQVKQGPVAGRNRDAGSRSATRPRRRPISPRHAPTSALSNSTNERWKELLTTESVSKQDADEKAGDAAAKKAAADSAGRQRGAPARSRVVQAGGGARSTASSPRATPTSAR